MDRVLALAAFAIAAVPAFAACDGTMRARIELYAPKSGPRPSMPVARSSGTVWYADANATAIVPFNISTHAFGTPVPDPTAIPADAPLRLRGARLAPGPLAATADGSLWGVGTAQTRWARVEYASTSAIVSYDPKGFTRAYSIPVEYIAGDFTFTGPNERPWSMVWTEQKPLAGVQLNSKQAGMLRFTIPRARFPAAYAAVVQLNADGTVSPEFTVLRDRLPRVYSGARYARGLHWLRTAREPSLRPHPMARPG